MPSYFAEVVSENPRKTKLITFPDGRPIPMPIQYYEIHFTTDGPFGIWAGLAEVPVRKWYVISSTWTLQKAKYIKYDLDGKPELASANYTDAEIDGTADVPNIGKLQVGLIRAALSWDWQNRKKGMRLKRDNVPDCYEDIYAKCNAHSYTGQWAAANNVAPNNDVYCSKGIIVIEEHDFKAEFPNILANYHLKLKENAKREVVCSNVTIAGEEYHAVDYQVNQDTKADRPGDAKTNADAIHSVGNPPIVSTASHTGAANPTVTQSAGTPGLAERLDNIHLAHASALSAAKAIAANIPNTTVGYTSIVSVGTRNFSSVTAAAPVANTVNVENPVENANAATAPVESSTVTEASSKLMVNNKYS